MITKEKLWDHISPEPNTGCWLWDGRVTWGGYPLVFDEKKLFLAHRVAYMLYRGDITKPCLDHLCRVRCCVNPDHLEPITHRENTNRGTVANRVKTHCARGHALTPDNVYWLLVKDGYYRRKCRTCNREYQRERRAKI